MRQVLITGGGSGIGRGIAQAMADAGDAVTIAGRRMDALQETDGGRGMTCLTCDVTDEASVNALFTQPYDVVIANAGAGKSMKLRDMPLDVFKIGLVRALATEVARDGITCNAVCPGFVDTPMGQAAAEGVAARFNISLEEATARITSGNPMRRMITVDEVVAAVTFLASEGASMVNGHTLSVSGGEI